MIRYFLQFPSQTQVVDEILPAIEKLESTTDKSKDLIEIEAFEKHLIILLKTNQYASYDKETLIESFRMLDIEKNGYLDLHTFYSYIKSYGITFTKEQIEEMEKFLLENDNEVFESLGTKNDEPIKHKPGMTTRKFYYENYVRKVLSDDEKHFDSIMKEYKSFFDDYMETKKFPEMPLIITKPVVPEPEKEKPKDTKKEKGKKTEADKKGNAEKKEEEKKANEDKPKEEEKNEEPKNKEDKKEEEKPKED